jgi:hypothetical protein
MTSQHVHERLVARSVTGRYTAFLGIGAGLALLGAILLLRSMTPEGSARAWQLFHVNWVYFTGLMFGSVAVAAAAKITNAKWSGVMLRFAEAAIAFLPVSLIGLVLIFTAGYEPIYGRMHAELEGMQHAKAVWLSHGFMFARMGLGVLLLGWVGWLLVRADMLPDVHAARGSVSGGRRALFEKWSRGFDPSVVGLHLHRERIHRLAPVYALLYAMIMSIIAFDAIMALQPHWFSNLLGGFYFMGSFLGGHTLLALLMLYGARELDIADLVSPKQRHDLGKLCFGFTVFWAYLMWAQFLVIWYGNMPEETGFVYARLWGHWLPVGRVVLIGMFIVPFFGLLGVLPKKTRATLGLFTAISLAALWVERFLLIVPSVSPLPGPAFGVPELAPTFLMTGLFLLTYALFARTFPMVSPRLAEITINRELGHHTVDIFDHEDREQDYLHEEEVEAKE